jgi:hypothetical protein
LVIRHPGKSKNSGGAGYFSNEDVLSVESRIQFTGHFIEFIVVETKQFVGIIVNVILTRTQQTCSQRSSMSAGSKHRAIGNDFSDLVCFPNLEM